jgi:predicted  nucleic acid-binding Zn-ribbon protein
MMNLLSNIQDLSHHIPKQRERVDAAVAELHDMERRFISLASQCVHSYSQDFKENEALKREVSNLKQLNATYRGEIENLGARLASVQSKIDFVEEQGAIK